MIKIRDFRFNPSQLEAYFPLNTSELVLQVNGVREVVVFPNKRLRDQAISELDA